MSEDLTFHQKLKAWVITVAICGVILAFIVGVFFLKTYRWGDCA